MTHLLDCRNRPPLQRGPATQQAARGSRNAIALARPVGQRRRVYRLWPAGGKSARPPPPGTTRGAGPAGRPQREKRRPVGEQCRRNMQRPASSGASGKVMLPPPPPGTWRQAGLGRWRSARSCSPVRIWTFGYAWPFQHFRFLPSHSGIGDDPFQAPLSVAPVRPQQPNCHAPAWQSRIAAGGGAHVRRAVRGA